MLFSPIARETNELMPVLRPIPIDKKKKKTHYLRKHELIKEMKIENIFKDKVILSSEGEEIDLRL